MHSHLSLQKCSCHLSVPLNFSKILYAFHSLLHYTGLVFSPPSLLICLISKFWIETLLTQFFVHIPTVLIQFSPILASFFCSRLNISFHFSLCDCLWILLHLVFIYFFSSSCLCLTTCIPARLCISCSVDCAAWYNLCK